MRKAAAGLEEIAAGECDKLALDEEEELPGMAEEAEVGSGVKDRVLVSYLLAYEASGRLDEEAYWRLMLRHSGSTGSVKGEQAKRVRGEVEAGGEGIGAEDALLLLDMAIR